MGDGRAAAQELEVYMCFRGDSSTQLLTPCTPTARHARAANAPREFEPALPRGDPEVGER